MFTLLTLSINIQECIGWLLPRITLAVFLLVPPAFAQSVDVNDKRCVVNMPDAIPPRQSEFCPNKVTIECQLAWERRIAATRDYNTAARHCRNATRSAPEKQLKRSTLPEPNNSKDLDRQVNEPKSKIPDDLLEDARRDAGQTKNLSNSKASVQETLNEVISKTRAETRKLEWCNNTQQSARASCHSDVSDRLGVRLRETCLSMADAQSMMCRAKVINDKELIRRAKISIGDVQEAVENLGRDIARGAFVKRQPRRQPQERWNSCYKTADGRTRCCNARGCSDFD